MKKIKGYKEELLKARKRSLASFSDMNHRLETLGFVNGVEWINDSKATDLESTHYSLSLFKLPIIWIVESTKIQKDYSIFEKLARYNVKTIVCFGDYETNIKYTLGSVVSNYAHKPSLEEAVSYVKNKVSENEVVLFSPACPTGDNYETYVERGEDFKRIVKGL